MQALFRRIIVVLGCCQSVEHQHADGHRTNATGDGRDETAKRGNFVELNVTAKAETFRAAGVGYAGRAYIDDGRTRLYHFSRDKFRSAYGGNQYVGAAANLL